jgi:WD40 repeat protein
MALCTREDGYSGSVTVYDASGAAVYKWYSGDGYVLSAEVSPDSKSVAVLVLTPSGSQIVMYDLDSVEEKAVFNLDGTVILDVEYPEKDRIVAVAESSLILLDTDGRTIGTYDLSDKHIGDYSTDGDGFTVLAYTDYTVGTQGRLVTIDSNGEVLGQIETSDEILSISAVGDRIAVLYSGSLVIYNKDLSIRQTADTTGGLLGAMLREDGSVLLTDKYTISISG